MTLITENKTKQEAVDASWQPDTKARFLLLISDGGFSEVVYDGHKHKFVAVRTRGLAYPLQDIIRERQELLLFPDMEYQVFLSSPRNTLVPSAIYTAENTELLFGLNHKLNEGDVILSEPLKQLQAQLLFAVSAEERALCAQLSSQSLHHSSACWLEMLAQLHKNGSRTALHADMDGAHIHIAVFIEGVFQFYNCFPAATEEDKLYFLMFVSEQLRINPHRDSYYISGHIFRHDVLHSLLARYIKELHFEARPRQYHYALPLHNLPEHFYFKAFSTPLCEL